MKPSVFTPYDPLNEVEAADLAAWTAKRAQQKLMKNEGQLALIFTGTGIGRCVRASVRDKDGNVTERDITDYSCW